MKTYRTVRIREKEREEVKEVEIGRGRREDKKKRGNKSQEGVDRKGESQNKINNK